MLVETSFSKIPSPKLDNRNTINFSLLGNSVWDQVAIIEWLFFQNLTGWARALNNRLASEVVVHPLTKELKESQ